MEKMPSVAINRCLAPEASFSLLRDPACRRCDSGIWPPSTGARINDGGVIQFIGDDGVVRLHQRLEEAAIGVEAGAVKDGVVHAQEVAQTILELFVDGLRAADEAHAGQAVSPLSQRLVRGFDDVRMIRQPEIVVGAKIEDRSALRNRDHGLLRADDDTLALYKPPSRSRPAFAEDDSAQFRTSRRSPLIGNVTFAA